MVDKEKKKSIRRKAFELVAKNPLGVPHRLAKAFNISRQAAHQHIKALVAEGLLEAQGVTRARIYHLAPLRATKKCYPREGLAEDIAWREVFAPLVSDLPENVRQIWQYGVTEMVNNAIDHSGSEFVTVGMTRNALFTDGWVLDEGEGIFLKIQKALGFYDPREAILELAKGKLTTEPDRHTGEGIFFTSKVFDQFDIVSGKLHFLHSGEPLDILFERRKDASGTFVIMRLTNDSTRTIKEVLDQFAVPEEYTFARTVVPVKLALYEGESLVSRSQAKRLSMRFERFQYVVLDFDGVAEIGQAFADELFRVFSEANPQVLLTWINTTLAVENMIKRVHSPAASTRSVPFTN